MVHVQLLSTEIKGFIGIASIMAASYLCRNKHVENKSKNLIYTHAHIHMHVKIKCTYSVVSTLGAKSV